MIPLTIQNHGDKFLIPLTIENPVFSLQWLKTGFFVLFE